MIKFVFVAFVVLVSYYLVDSVGYQMAILYILAAAGVHNISISIKKSILGNTEGYRELGAGTPAPFQQNPEFNIVAASEKTVGEHNGIEIPEFLIMENNSIYEYKTVHSGAAGPTLALDEIMLDTGLIYKKSIKTLEEIQEGILSEMYHNVGIDPKITQEELETLRMRIQSILDDGASTEPIKKPRRKRAQRDKPEE